MLNKLLQGFCAQMPFLSPTNRYHSLDPLFSLTTKTLKQGKRHHSLYVGSLTPVLQWLG